MLVCISTVKGDCPSPGFTSGGRNFIVGDTPESLVEGDFNEDAHIDLAVANSLDKTVSILLGDGTGNFSHQAISLNDEPNAIAVGDFNEDNNSDIATGNVFGTVSILLGNGNGTFETPVDYTASGMSILSMATAFFNSDQHLDLAVAIGSTEMIQIFVGNGDGTFTAAGEFPVVNDPFHVVAADFNSDGKQDIVTGNGSYAGISVLIGNGDGTFQQQVNYPTDFGPSFLVIGNFDSGPTLDIATANAEPDSVSILLGNGDGTFEANVNYPLPNLERMAGADFDQDGNLDLVVGGTGILVLRGNGDGTFTPDNYQGNFVPSTYFVTADLKEDGYIDLAGVNPAFGSISVLYGNGDRTFGSLDSFDTGTWPWSAVFKDFNHDSFVDIATANQGVYVGFPYTVSIHLGKGDGTFEQRTDITVGVFPTSITSDDFNQDGNLDLAVAINQLDLISILIGDGTGQFAQVTPLPLSSAHYVVAEDFNNDGIPDLAATHPFAPETVIYSGNGDGTFHPISTVGAFNTQPATGDFNNDGNIDLVYNYGGSIYVLFGNGDGTFDFSASYLSLTEDNVVAVDFNSDGVLDLASSNMGGSVSVLLGNANGTFNAASFYAVHRGSLYIATGDFNGDGILDISTSNTHTGTVSILFGTGDGTFSSSSHFIAGRGVGYVGAEDVNVDGRTDLIALNPSPNTISILQNLCGNAVPIVKNDSYITAKDATLNVASPGVLSNDFDSDGEPIQALLSIPPLHGMVTLNLDGSFVYQPDQGYTGPDSFQYRASDLTATSAIATVSISVGCLLCDTFEDGILDPNWTDVKPAWTETGGTLFGSPIQRKAVAIASPIFSGCQTCYQEFEISSNGGERGIVTILGWYVDKRNTMELLLKEDKNKIILKQRIDGVLMAKKNATFTLEPDTPYSIRISFNGSIFEVSINGSLLFTLTPQGKVPSGTIGFQSEGTVVSVKSLVVN